MNRVPVMVWRLMALLAAVLLVPLLPPGLPARPDVVLILVAAVALRGGPVAAALVGLVGGWIIDLVPPGGDPLGGTALVLAAAGLAMGSVRGWQRVSPLAPFALVLLGAAVVQGVRGVTAAAGFGTAPWPELAWSIGMTGAFAVVLLPLFLQVERVLHRAGWA